MSLRSDGKKLLLWPVDCRASCLPRLHPVRSPVGRVHTAGLRLAAASCLHERSPRCQGAVASLIRISNIFAHSRFPSTLVSIESAASSKPSATTAQRSFVSVPILSAAMRRENLPSRQRLAFGSPWGRRAEQLSSRHRTQMAPLTVA